MTASGAKNAALPIMAASLLTREAITIHHVPRLRDTETMVRILTHLGAKVSFAGNTLKIDPSSLNRWTAPYELVSTMRASICLLGPLIGRCGQAKFSMPGGCVIGPRPIDLHLKGLARLGVSIRMEEGYVVAEARKLKGNSIFLGGAYGSSVLATANVMTAATLADGVSWVEFAACEPEIVDLAIFLKSMGARITGEGSHLIRIEGVKKLHGTEHTLIPDRIETGTFLLAGAATRGRVRVTGCRPKDLFSLVDKLEESGVTVKQGPDWIEVTGNRKWQALDIVTWPYPGFPTDLQAQMMAFLTKAEGVSSITEKVYPDRFIHIGELNRLGASISLDG
ncbi:MAG: UDP-N-acetylglucosamine 1-carboxyvinyltransferase, partial [Candidatus Omnitrophica bacterium]|nr:UDP-N-acetylglucosamine 1-carboxyvinyltransferase [Candidatus Omnitrophota bacterium]